MQRRTRWRPSRGFITWGIIALLILLLFVPAPTGDPAAVTLGGTATGGTAALRAGAASVSITPFTKAGQPFSNDDPDWQGGVTASGLWGEPYTDTNGNGRWDKGEPFTDDPANTALDESARGVWNGIYLAGFGSDRPATGVADPIWVRTVLLQGSGITVAWAAVDLQGYFSHHLDEVRRTLSERYPAVKVDEIILTSTHNHEGPDAFGMWGPDEFTDGKYPQYIAYINRKIAQSIAEAYGRIEPVSVRWGAATPRSDPELAGMAGRNSCRAPWFFDDELRVMQLTGRSGTVATLTNWAVHPESLGSRNSLISADFPHAIRQTLEERYGGIAIHTPGALGAAEVVGDSCTQVADRSSFDGKEFPVDPQTGRPKEYSLERTYAIGRTVGNAAIRALEKGEHDPTATGLTLAYEEVDIPLTNQALRLLATLGVLDLPTYFADRWQMPAWASTTVRTRIYHWQIGQGSFITAPGEEFPEIWYGLAENARSDWRETTSGRPFEPAVRTVQPGKYRFLIGLTPDQFGYIVPAYDYAIYGVPGITGAGLGALIGEVEDKNRELLRNYVAGKPAVAYKQHYQETNGAGSMLAPAVTCAQLELVGGDPAKEPSCQEWRRYKSALLRLHNPLQDFSTGSVRHK